MGDFSEVLVLVVRWTACVSEVAGRSRRITSLGVNFFMSISPLSLKRPLFYAEKKDKEVSNTLGLSRPTDLR